TDNDARLHSTVVEQVSPKANHAVDEVSFDKLAAHFPLLTAEQHAVREKDGAAPCLRVHALQDVLEERIVGAALRRRAKEVAAPHVGRPRRTVPLLNRV